jgi:hypothetical protein
MQLRKTAEKLWQIKNRHLFTTFTDAAMRSRHNFAAHHFLLALVNLVQSINNSGLSRAICDVFHLTNFTSMKNNNNLCGLSEQRNIF